MTLVDTTTGEIVADITAGDARDLTDQIRFAVDGTWQLIKRAYETRAHAALGYTSWDDYCAQEFGGSRLRLPREERQEVIGSLRDAGLSIRAIAATGVASKKTIERDLQVSSSRTPALSRCQLVGHDWHGPGPCPTADDRGQTNTAPVKGTDGKTYTPPAPKAPPTAAEQRAKDIADGNRRAARYLEQLTDCWPYFESFHKGTRRDEVAALLVQPTLDALAKIEEALR